MYSSFSITNYRIFHKLDIASLGRINLIVGKNNSGKSSLLEAMYAVGSGDPVRVFTPLYSRGERLKNDSVNRQTRVPLLDIRQLFHGRQLFKDSMFSIEAEKRNGRPDYLACRVTDLSDEYYESGAASVGQLYFDDASDDESVLLDSVGLHMMYNYHELDQVPLYGGGVDPESLRKWSRSVGHLSSPASTFFVSTAALQPEVVTSYWSDVALTSDEDMVIEALRMLDTRISRIALSGIDASYSGRYSRKDGIVLKLDGVVDRCPIGSMGDGIWRLLGLTLAALKAKNGVLLVDEVDTGLHYTALPDVWMLLDSISRKHNVQIMATTHSWDCIQAYSQVASKMSDRYNASLHRVDSAGEGVTSFQSDEIVYAVESGIELR